MCGIAGFITREVFDYEETIRSMTEILNHRGPNMQGYFESRLQNDYILKFGHVRLSILDIVGDRGKQPMDSLDGRYTIIFNGEIYNYLELKELLMKNGIYDFRTNTDTEIIIDMYSLYKEKCLDYFNGMFAFAIYDKYTQEVFIARDRLGKKPLYYSKFKNTFVFASEIKAILKIPNMTKEVNMEGLTDYLQFRYVRNPSTLFKNVYKLEPGYYLKYKNNKVQKKRYWDIKNDEIEKDVTKEDVEKLLLDSVKLRMRADVSVGAFLSGGLDSSLIVAMMSKFTDKKINTFSVGFEDNKVSELPYAKLVADYLGTNHHEVYINSKSVINNLEKCIYYRDEPISEPSEIGVYLLAKEAQNKVTVVLTGEGSDESFAGYPKYAYDSLGESNLCNSVFKVVDDFTSSRTSNCRKIRQASNALKTHDYLERYDKWFASFSKTEIDMLMKNNDYRTGQLQEFKIKKSLSGFKSNLNRMQYYDIKYWLTDNLLDRADKMLMAASLEGRVPFLDYRIVEQAFLLKDSQKIKRGNCKKIIKDIAERYIPKKIINRKKVGFYIPVSQWFRTEMKDYLCDNLFSSDFLNLNLFNKKYIENIVNNHISGKEDNYKKLWMLLCLKKWFEMG